MPRRRRTRRNGEIAEFNAVVNRIPGTNRVSSIDLRFVQTAANRNIEQADFLEDLITELRYLIHSNMGHEIDGRRINNRTLYDRVRGYFVLQTPLGNAASIGNTSVADLNPESILDFISNRILTSATNFNILNIDWSFVINQRTYMRGGANRVKTKYKKNLYKMTEKEQCDEYGPISCAAFALSYRMNFDKYKNASIDRIKKDARELQTLLGWEQYVSVIQLEDFVKKFPEYRLTWLTKGGMKQFRNQTYEGALFDTSILQQGRSITSCKSKVIYLVFDVHMKHFFAINSPTNYFRAESNSNAGLFCHTCIELVPGEIIHNCDDWILHQEPVRKIQIRTCEFCGNRYQKHCDCSMKKCQNCNAFVQNNFQNHRCIVYKDPEISEVKQKFNQDNAPHPKLYSLWAYDLEARVHIVTTEVNEIKDFTETDFVFDGTIKSHELQVRKHEANLVVARNIFTNQEMIWKGDGCLEEFIQFMMAYNNGKNICVAHNGSGYDTRLIFEKATQMELQPSLSPILRGTKFLKLDIGNLKFRDSLLHLPGSLRALAKDFCTDVHLEKGYFPHLFNSVENYGYSGPIPDLNYFDLSFVIKDDKEMASFLEWYNGWQGEWNFQTELEKYCRNDVLVLACIMKSYNEILVNKFELSPWFKTTAPSYIHDVYLRKIALTLELPDKKENKEEYQQRVQELADNEYWAVLTEPEYFFARKALRGGRTEIRKMYHQVSDEEWSRGIRIRYQDICSQYPYQQAVHDFPVGTPTVYVWDNTCFPCSIHLDLNCTCNVKSVDPKICVVRDAPIPTNEELMNWFGIVCCTIKPSNLYHPVLVHFDEMKQKTIASCNLIERGVFTSVELNKALEMGYEIVQLHRYDKYAKKKSLWADTIKDLFIEKMVNSGTAPTEEIQEQLIRDYEELFGMGDELIKTFQEQRWSDNPAMRQTFKIMLNSGWGKHAQKPVSTEAIVLNRVNDTAKEIGLFENFSNDNYEFQSIEEFGVLSMFRYKKNVGKVKVDLHNSYLPAALFVPAYGRLHLWEQLHKLGDRVLMHDTDSIVYLYDPTLYNIPEGNVWGQWEVEKEDKHNGGIRTFVGVGPKTYSFKCDNGYTKVRCKGFSLKRSTQNLVNFDTMESMVLSFLQTNLLKKIKLPQQSFQYKFGQGITTRKFIKLLQVQPYCLKGTLTGDGYLLPFGYNPYTI